MTKKQIVDSALKIIQDKRTENELKSENNYKTAREKSKEFKKADLLFREKTVEYAKTNNQNIKNELETLRQKRLFELKKLGFSEKDLTPSYSCKLCNDTGFVDNKKCVCLQKEIQKQLIKNSGITSSIVHDFSQSDPLILQNNEMLAKAHTLAKKYVEKFPNIKTQNLVFMGEVGTGKTFLLECIAKELLQKEFYVVYVTAFNLSNTMLKAMTLPPYESEIILSPLLGCDLLIVDDLGAEPIFRNLTSANMFTILNERGINGLPTLISTNLKPEDIEERYGNRVFSRLFNKRTSKVLLFSGNDLRIK